MMLICSHDGTGPMVVLWQTVGEIVQKGRERAKDSASQSSKGAFKKVMMKQSADPHLTPPILGSKGW